MKLVASIFSILLLAACNFQEGVKETGDVATKSIENVIEGVKQAPKAIGEASNKIEADLRK